MKKVNSETLKGQGAEGKTIWRDARGGGQLVPIWLRRFTGTGMTAGLRQDAQDGQDDTAVIAIPGGSAQRTVGG